MLEPKNVKPGKEQYEPFHSGYGARAALRYQYDYRDYDGSLFSTVCYTLEECRRRRDAWLAAKEVIGALEGSTPL